MANLSFDLLWRDHGASRGLRDLGREADNTSKKFGSLSKQGSGVSGLAGSIGKLGGPLAAAGGAVLKFGGLAAGALGAAAIAAGGYGLSVAASNEQAEISFTTMLGSAEKAGKFLKDLQQFAATTPFEFPELQTAASSLISAGIEADKVIPIMKTLGDVTSGMGTGSEGVQRATVALQQMSAAGRITGEDLNQLRDAGIPVYDLLSKATGKSKEEVVKLAQAGKLGKRELGQMMEALESGAGLERFSGLMDKQSQSLSGMVSTLKDTFGQGLAEAVQPAIPTIKGLLGDVSAAAADGFAWIKDHRDDIAKLSEAVRKSLGTIAEIATTAFGGFSDSVAGGEDAFSAFADYVTEHQDELTTLFIDGTLAAIGMGKGIATMASGGLRAFGAFASGFDTLQDRVQANMQDMVEDAATMMRQLGMDGMADKLDGVAAAIQRTRDANAATDSGKWATDMANQIDNNVIPALDSAKDGVTKLGEKYNKMAKKQVTTAEFKRQVAEADSRAYREYVNAERKKQNILSKAEFERKTGETSAKKYREYVNAEQAKHKVLSKAEWSRKAAEESARKYREYVNREHDKHKVLSKAEWSRKTGEESAKKYREYVNEQNAKHKTLSKAQWDAKDARAKAKSYREYVNEQQDKINKRVDVKVNWDTTVDKMNTQLTMKYGKNAKLISAGGPSMGAPLSASVGPDTHPPASSIGAPVGGPGPNGGGPTLGQVTTAGTRAVTSHGTGAIKELLKQLSPALADSSGAPGGKGPTRRVGPGWGPVESAMRKHGATTFNTYPGHHPSAAMARDVYPHNWAAANAAKALSSVWYVIYRMRIASKNYGNGWRQYRPTNFNGDWQHVRHIHVARRYDTGGQLPSGGIAVNQSGRPERVLSPVQTRNFENLVRVLDRQGGATTVVYQITAPNYIGSRDELVRTLTELDRRGRLTALKR